jgi:hypothetical protein
MNILLKSCSTYKQKCFVKKKKGNFFFLKKKKYLRRIEECTKLVPPNEKFNINEYTV